MIDVQFFEEDHRYLLNSEDCPSVTTIMGAEGLTDYEWCEEHHRIRGSLVHKIAQIVSRDWSGSTVEEIVNNSRWDVSQTTPALVGYGYAVAKFLLEHQFHPSIVERPVGSLRFGACGTPDAYGLLPTGNTLLADYKSGRPLPAVWIQLNLYALMLEETLGVKPDLLAPVWLKANGDYQIWPTQVPGGASLTAGKSAINLYKWRKQFKML